MGPFELLKNTLFTGEGSWESRKDLFRLFTFLKEYQRKGREKSSLRLFLGKCYNTSCFLSHVREGVVIREKRLPAGWFLTTLRGAFAFLGS
jgi:hypothetical protein